MKLLRFLQDDNEFKVGDVALLGDKDADQKLFDRIAELADVEELVEPEPEQDAEPEPEDDDEAAGA